MIYTINNWMQLAWDIGCITSIVGIWPRFIEPELISITKVDCPFKKLHDDLKNFRILQFSDLHLSSKISNRYLDRLSKQIMKQKPDLIVFTGDFLCYSKMEKPNRLEAFLNSLDAPYGCFAILGNHDYAKPVLVNTSTGEYDAFERKEGNVAAGLKLLLKKSILLGRVSENAKKIGFHQPLIKLLERTPFQLLHNQTVRISVKNAHLNITGLGEHMLGQNRPDIAFKNIDKDSLSIVLTHNPDSVSSLQDEPGDLILCGHTHGAQINLWGLWNRLTLMENPRYKRGLFHLTNKTLYVNRGIGSVFKFRLFSCPEITMFHLKGSS